MSLIRRSRSGFPSLFDDFFNRDLMNWDSGNFSPNATVPSVNIKETADNYEVEMAAPGMNKDDFKIELDGNLLTISSSKEYEDEKRDDGYARKEFSYRSFQRSFNFPKDVVDEDKIEAKYENGLLKLTIPKKEEAKRKGPRLINIS
ncbi:MULTISPECIES: Hsp20/alpha crystallin family protein [Olivibacter]|jgi:HSP20 family protein|uniref:Hsp20/alpha crystallin family protein n=1 Tax=Olivibacter oleidegradans TaxID=760123 RepID=A0ABV6HI60_9SPHI|nr:MULTISPECIES: Hsp20/alpha crystallin family protein [Olivibacter]MDM8174650.1 Hsp20/alpha crystallin family protein [Olivibacter sp. 47]QEL01448.1 Hsp20/alpha crystallin family protein [Olivibacter sp. LS-1]